jgi:integrase
VELAAIRPAHIRELDRHLHLQGLSVWFRPVVFSNVATILNAAVDDERIARNPCHARTLKPPRTPPKKVVPWSCERVLAVRMTMAERYRLMVDLGAGCGLRQGEILGIGLEDLDYERRLIHVSRQIRIVGSRLVFALPKGRKKRDVPLPASVESAIAAHRSRVPSLEIKLPWDVPSGRPHLGHSDPGFTLRTYTHLMPTSEERTRKAVDNALGGADLDHPDGLTTA